MANNLKINSWVNFDMNEIQSGSSNNSKLLFYTKKSPLKSGPNEDSMCWIEIENHTILAVADGAGGHPDGDIASKMAISALIEEANKLKTKKNVSESSIREMILNSFESANQKIIKKNKNMATTLAVAHLHDGHCRFYHTGDSELLIISNKAKMRYHSVSHSPTGHAIEAGLLTSSESLEHPERNLVHSFVGQPEMKIEIGPKMAISNTDKIIVCSDGLTDNFTHSELEKYLKNGHREEVLSQVLGELDRRMRGTSNSPFGKADDCSLIVYSQHKAA